ncbi:MAG: YopX family protein [Psychrobacter alimentarius]
MNNLKFRQFDKRLNNFMLFELNNGRVHIINSDIESFDIDRKDSPQEQFTGLTDKSGVEIYEGDIIQYGTPLTHQSSILWSRPDFGFITYNEMLGEHTGLSFFIGYKNFEVIGNIHQNPELLEQNDE